MPKFITIRDVCDKYGLSDKTVRRKIKSGEITAYRCGPRLLKLDADQVAAALMRPAKPESLDDIVNRIVAELPPLSDEQCQRIAALLMAGSGAA